MSQQSERIVFWQTDVTTDCSPASIACLDPALHECGAAREAPPVLLDTDEPLMRMV